MMKTFCLFLLLPLSMGFAESLQFAGVLGNSGEHGPSLVKFGAQSAEGFGVVFDRYGSIWDRGGDKVLNRYAVDGRLLATYPIPSGARRGDRLTSVGDDLVLLVNGKIHILPIDAVSGTKPVDTGVAAEGMSLASVDGKLAIYQKGKMNWWDVKTGALEPIWSEEVADVRAFDVMPDGTLAYTQKSQVWVLPKGKKVAEAIQKPSPGDALQFLDGYWYGARFHGTLRRFSPAFEAEPGVVLGGGSGSFIGHVDQISEIGSPSGVAAMGEGKFALSGYKGVVHLMVWDEAKKQMVVERRIGAIPSCRGLAINRQGDIWYDAGMWKWEDRPESPQQNCSTELEIGQAVNLPNDRFIAPTTRGGMNLMGGDFTWKKEYSKLTNVPKDLLQGSAIYTADNVLTMLVIDRKGKGRAFRISIKGDFQSELGAVELLPAKPVKNWTSLAMKDGETLLAGADGFVIEFKREGKNWKEIRRWNSWGADGAQKFGGKLFITSDENRLWVSDTERDRVCVFELNSGKWLTSYGEVDSGSSALKSLHGPEVLSARGKRAVVFDAQNQRLVKLYIE